MEDKRFNWDPRDGFKGRLWLFRWLLLLVIFFSFFTIGRVPSSSMEPTLMPGDVLIYQRSFWTDYSLQDIVRFHRDDTSYVKRITAVPGDEVSLPYEGMLFQEETEIILMPTEYYVEGDNASDSIDSRTYGPIGRTAIKGKALFRLYPLSRIGSIE